MSENDERNAITESMSNIFGIDLNKISIKNGIQSCLSLFK